MIGPIDSWQRQGVFNNELLIRLKDYYDSIGTYRSPVMRKADPGKALEWVEPILRQSFPIKKFLGGNFYKHETPYHPHVDHLPDWPLAVNFVIPIFVEGPPVDFIVFDQRWHMKPITWSMVQKVNEFFRNGKFTVTMPEHGIPGSQEIEGHTKTHIDKTFWETHLDHPHEYYFGLSGKAFPFTPGSLIMFETKHIHCTGKFKGLKLGLTLRYSVEEA
jgi:hypothetical protein